MLMNTIVLRSALKYTNNHYTWFILKGQTLFSKTVIFIPFEICNYIFLCVSFYNYYLYYRNSAILVTAT